jgi:hypothetical protein
MGKGFVRVAVLAAALPVAAAACGTSYDSADAGTPGADASALDASVPSATDASSSVDAANDAGDAGTNDARVVSDAGDASSCSTNVGAGLVGYWKLDEGTGTLAVDATGSGFTGTLMNAPTWSPDVPPTPYANTHSLLFDGSTQLVTMGNPTALNITGAISLGCWFKTSDAVGSYRTLVSKWWSGDADGAYDLVWVSGTLYFQVRNAQSYIASASSGVSGNDGKWHFALGTWDGTTIAFYLDGVAVDEETVDASFAPIATTTYAFDVASDERYPAGMGDRFFSGEIDDVRVYNRAITASEVHMLFDGTCGGGK